jgi:cytosine/uracil/thiamine/allantoin permease
VGSIAAAMAAVPWTPWPWMRNQIKFTFFVKFLQSYS